MSQIKNLGILHENTGSLQALINKGTGFGNKWPGDATLVHLPNLVNIYTLFRPNIDI